MGYDKFGTGESFDSCDKFGSGGQLYKPGEDESKVPVSPEESLENIKQALIQMLQPILDACYRILQKLVDTFTPQTQQAIKEISRINDSVLKSYPDKRIVWLALHHKKERIRKKNRKRILKWLERNVKSGNKTNR